MNTLWKEPRNYMGSWLNKDQNPKYHEGLKWKMASTASLTGGKHSNPPGRDLSEKVYSKIPGKEN